MSRSTAWINGNDDRNAAIGVTSKLGRNIAVVDFNGLWVKY